MRFLVVLLMLGVTLAGCAENSEPVQEDDPVDLELQATSTTGVVRGVIVDPSIVPIAGATVRIDSLDLETTSNEDGAFGFQDLEPGVYFLNADKLGYTSVQSSVTVEAGVDKPPAVRLMLELDLAELPFYVPLKWDGHMLCGLSVIALCGVVELVYDTPDEFITVIELDTPGVTYWQSEMIWKTTTSLSPNMALWQGATGDGGCWLDEHMSGSPLVMNLTLGDLGDFGDADCFNSLGNTTDLHLRVFSGSIDGTRPPTDNGCYPVINFCAGVGATLEQPFEVFNHVFYDFKPPEGWQFSVDGEPVVPA